MQKASLEVIRKMIRIMTADEPTLTMITVEGQLAGDSIQVVETSCDQARSNGKPIWLFLRDVSIIGEDGQALLRRLAAKGVRLKASGIYTSYIVQSIQPERVPQTAESAPTPVPTLVATRDETNSPRQRQPAKHRIDDSGADCREMPVRGEKQ
jgi:hypothetical protein